MSSFNNKIEHTTVEPRTSKENTVEKVRINNPKPGSDDVIYLFERVGECLDVWEFEEVQQGDDVITEWEHAFTTDIIVGILKRTPVVDIRDSRNNSIASVEYSDEIRDVNALIELP